MYHNLKKQRGGMIIIGIVMMLIIAYLALNLLRVEGNNNSAVTKKVIGTQAWFLAHSGVEWGLVQLFPLGSQAADTSYCNGTTNSSNGMANTISNCPNDPSVECNATTVTYKEEQITYFHIVSTVTCGSGVNEVTRSQETWAKEIF